MSGSPSILLDGRPQIRDAFKATHPGFVACVAKLARVGRATFDRTFASTSLAEKIVFYGGNVCSEDFAELALLAANGFGIGALKILRGLYERTVTVGYIAQNPEQAVEFAGYHDIETGKHLNHARDEKMLREGLRDVPEATLRDIDDRYRAAKAHYVEPVCECGKTRVMTSWSKLDLKSMARATTMPDGTGSYVSLYLPCYIEPTLHAHATASAIARRISVSADGLHVAFDNDQPRSWGEHSIRFGHQLLILVFATQNRLFQLGLDAEIKTLIDEFQAAWAAREDSPSSPSSEVQ